MSTRAALPPAPRCLRHAGLLHASLFSLWHANVLSDGEEKPAEDDEDEDEDDVDEDDDDDLLDSGEASVNSRVNLRVRLFPRFRPSATYKPTTSSTVFPGLALHRSRAE